MNNDELGYEFGIYHFTDDEIRTINNMNIDTLTILMDRELNKDDKYRYLCETESE